MNSAKQAELNKAREKAKAQQVQEIVNAAGDTLTKEEIEALKKELREVIRLASFD